MKTKANRTKIGNVFKHKKMKKKIAFDVEKLNEELCEKKGGSNG